LWGPSARGIASPPGVSCCRLHPLRSGSDRPITARRDSAYDARPASSGRLVEALRQAPAQGWLVVDMARDWTVLFAPGVAAA